MRTTPNKENKEERFSKVFPSSPRSLKTVCLKRTISKGTTCIQIPWVVCCHFLTHPPLLENLRQKVHKISYFSCHFGIQALLQHYSRYQY
eukprot:GHVP01013285.1.p1 GENE.GHVP01013285.1~~GHVP01013285.1.p1  ORF type:complete len:100 (-),score=7.56 GHVP01013285.1:60-329(-)